MACQMGLVALIDCTQEFFRAIRVAAAVLVVEMIVGFRAAHKEIVEEVEIELHTKARAMTQDRLWVVKPTPEAPAKCRKSSERGPRKRIRPLMVPDKTCDNDRDADTNTA